MSSVYYTSNTLVTLYLSSYGIATLSYSELSDTDVIATGNFEACNW